MCTEIRFGFLNWVKFKNVNCQFNAHGAFKNNVVVSGIRKKEFVWDSYEFDNYNANKKIKDASFFIDKVMALLSVFSMKARRGDRRDPRAAQSRDSRAAEKLYSSEMNRLISVRRGDGKFYRKIFGLKYDYFYYYHCVYSGVVTVGGVRWWRSNVLIRQRKLSSCDSPRPGNHIWPYQGCLSALLGGRGGDSWKYFLPGNRKYFSVLEHDITKRLTTEQNVWLRLIYVLAMTGGLTELYFPMFPSRHRPRLLLGRPVMLQ